MPKRGRQRVYSCRFQTTKARSPIWLLVCSELLGFIRLFSLQTVLTSKPSSQVLPAHPFFATLAHRIVLKERSGWRVGKVSVPFEIKRWPDGTLGVKCYQSSLTLHACCASRPRPIPSTISSTMNMKNFRCVSVLGRGHFGKVRTGESNCPLPLNITADVRHL